MSSYYAKMTNLTTAHHEYYEFGGFSVQVGSHNKGVRATMAEEAINKYTVNARLHKMCQSEGQCSQLIVSDSRVSEHWSY